MEKNLSKKEDVEKNNEVEKGKGITFDQFMELACKSDEH